MTSIEIRNPKSEIRNKFKIRMTQTQKNKSEIRSTKFETNSKYE
jgi:hypothetical protein